ncbi:MAG: PHP domain-containing protein [Magnetococcus sp. YQC-9]
MEKRSRRALDAGWFYPAQEPMVRLPRWEYHLHSDFSDGSSSIAEGIAMGRARGIERLIFTEHTEPDLVEGAGWFTRYVETVRALRGAVAGEMEVVLGLEIPLVDFDGTLLADERMLEEAEFILGAVHAYPGYGWQLAGIDPDRAIDLEYRALMTLAEHPLIDAIAHPGGVCEKYITPFPLDRFEEVVKRAKVFDKAIELNPAYHEPMTPYFEICRRHEVLLSPGSNAHHPEQIGLAWEVLRTL